MKRDQHPQAKVRWFNSLYWQIAVTFLLLLSVLAFLYVYLTAYSAKTYFEATHQRLNRETAVHIAHFMPPFKQGRVYQRTAERIFFNIMVMNPSVEVYLLDPKGKILSFYAQKKKIELTSISLVPIQQFIGTKGAEFILGDDPRHRGTQKIFSAAKVEKDNHLLGYIYVVLAGEEYDSAMELLLHNYILGLGSQTVLITLLAALVVGLIAFWLLTKNLNRLMQTVKRFREGDLRARITLQSRNELGLLASTFNEMADTLLENIEVLKTMEMLRRELVANVSHDLRTPIATVHGYAETLLMKQDSLSEEDRNRYAGIILQSTERLKNLVTELFELSKLEARDTTPHWQPFVLAELIQEVYLNSRIAAQQKGIAFTCESCENPALVYADVALTERALQNLVDNALKFTPTGGEVILRLEHPSQALLVSVTDNGPGIPSDKLPFLFDRYRKTDHTSAVPREGAGLGLVIVKKILELQHSQIQVYSQVGQGTRFSFRLPQYYPPA